MERSALPSINGSFADESAVPDTRPRSSMGTGSSASRRVSGILPKSAGATSASRCSNHNGVSMASAWQEWGKLSQRPTSTRRVSADRMAVRVFTSTPRKMEVERDSHCRSIQHQDEHEKGPEILLQEPDCDPRDEVLQLRDENTTFRNENDRLRTQLVEKMRGQYKVVAGGQFRAASASKVPIVPRSGCTKCVTARAKAVKAHHESEEAQAAIAELRKYVDNIESIRQQLWEDRNTHVGELVQLRKKLAVKVEECLLFEKECTKLHKQVHVLQSENGIDDAVPTECFVKIDEATQCTLQQSYDDEMKAAQLHEIVVLKDEVQLLVSQLNDREQELKIVWSDLEECQTMVQFEKEQHNHESKLRLKENSEHDSQVVELERSLNDLRLFLEELQRAQRKELQDIQETNQQLRYDIAATEREIETLKQQHKAETSAHELRHQTLIKALKVRIEQKNSDLNYFRALAEKHNADKAANNVTKQKVDDLEHQVQTLMEEKRQLADDNALHLLRAECERDKLQQEGTVEMQRLSDTLQAVEQHNRSMQTRISEVENEFAEQVSLMQKQKQSHARAIKRLMESSLRLCVVAPTVNVQLNTNRAILAKKSSNLSALKLQKEKDPGEVMSVMCRSTPRHDSIKRVIENDVLPLFTTVFLQGDDDASPKGNVPMNRWLQDLLHDMQARIAAQLESIYSSASVKSSE